MLTWGMHITQMNDPLQKASEEVVLRKIKNPSDQFMGQIMQLRTLKSLDEKMYKKQKTSLPYFVCSSFHPLIRRKENFAAATHFILDLDRCPQHNIEIGELKRKLSEDQLIRGMFISPGADGLKVLFKLSERITDPGIFSLFYKSFLLEFSRKYQLEQVVDFVTHDVTRACFFSADPEAYDNPHAIAVNVFDFVSEDSITDNNKIVMDFREKQSGKDSETSEKIPISDDVLALIRQRLRPEKQIRAKKEVYVPDELNVLMPVVRERLKELELDLQEESAIQFGKKLRIGKGLLWAEINVFFGRKGYSIVRTTKTGSNDEMGEIVASLIAEIVNP